MEDVEMKRNVRMMEKQNKMISAFVGGFVWILHISVKKREINLRKMLFFSRQAGLRLTVIKSNQIGKISILTFGLYYLAFKSL